MLERVDVISAQGDLMSMPLDNDGYGLQIVDIGGLGPVKASLVSSSFAGVDKEQYQSASRGKRNLTMKVELYPDPADDSVFAMRQRLYGYFMTKSEVTLRFYLENGLDVTINGRVESCDPDIFSAEPAMDIVILCFDPDFYNPEVSTVETTTTQGNFETLIPYSGTIETGVVFTMVLDRDLSEFTLYHRLPNGQLEQMDFELALLNGDILTISTVSGDKHATLTRAGSTSSVLYAVSPTSRWIELYPGENTVRIFDAGALIPYSIQYNTKYGAL